MKTFRLQGIYEQGKLIFTRNINFGKEKKEKEKEFEYREWDPFRSKLAAGLKKGLSQIGIKEGSIVLYLGSGSGTTASHVSDIVGENGFIFAIDIAPTVMRDFVFLCEKRKNIAPILSDSNHPEKYAFLISQADVVYMDIAQKNQVEIFLKNCKLFLKKGGFALLAVKARSIDVAKNPKDLFKKVRAELEKNITIVDYKELEPYERDHAMFVCKKTE